MFGICKGHHHGRHNHPEKQFKNHRGTAGHSHGRHHGHGHGHKHAHWHKFGSEVRTLYDTDSLSAGLSPTKQLVLEPLLAAAAATCPLCESHCFLNDPECGKGEAYALSLNPA